MNLVLHPAASEWPDDMREDGAKLFVGMQRVFVAQLGSDPLPVWSIGINWQTVRGKRGLSVGAWLLDEKGERVGGLENTFVHEADDRRTPEDHLAMWLAKWKASKRPGR